MGQQIRPEHRPGQQTAMIFDVDGVLVESPHERAWRESLSSLMHGDWRDVATAISFTPQGFSTEVYQRHVAGKPRMSGARAVLDYFAVPGAADRALVYAERKQAFIESLIAAGEFKAFADALRFVGALRRKGILMAAASSSKNANAMMAQLDLSLATGGAAGRQEYAGLSLLDVFDANVCGRDVEHGKPAPDLFLLAAEALGVPPSRCVVVEDATAGVAAANAGGMRAIGVARLDDGAILREAGAGLVVTTLDSVALDPLADGRLEQATRRPCE